MTSLVGRVATAVPARASAGVVLLGLLLVAAVRGDTGVHIGTHTGVVVTRDQPLAAISGQAQTATGAPVAGARVTLRQVVSQFDSYGRALRAQGPMPSLATTETDSRGHYRVTLPSLLALGDGVAEDVMLELDVRKPGTVAAVFTPILPDRSRTLPTVRLLRDRGTRVRVQAAQERPVSASEESPLAWVWARSLGRAIELGVGWQPAPRRARVDEHGLARLPRAAKERLELALVMPGTAVLARADGGEDARLALSGRPGAPATESRRLRVVHASGRPAAGLIVVDGRAAVPLGMTDEDGTLDLRVPRRRGLAMLDLLAANGSRWRELLPLTALRIAKPNGAPSEEALATLTAAWTVELAAESVVGGRVVGTDGMPIVGAQVYARADPGRVTRTDTAGNWTAFQPGVGPTRWRIDKSGFAVAAVTTVRGRRGFGPTVALVPVVAARGRVVDALGRGIEDVMVTARAQGRAAALEAASDPRAVSTADGRFVLHNLPAAGRYRLEATHAQFVSVVAAATTLERLPDLVLAPRRRGFGWIVGPDEQPIEGAGLEILATGLAGHRAEATTDGSGRWQVEELPGSSLSLHAFAPGFAPVTVRGIEVSQGLENGAIDASVVDLGVISLQPGQVLEGAVVDLAGRPVAAAAIELFGASRGVPREVATDAEGRFRIADLAAANVDLRVVAAGYVTARLSAVPVPRDRPLVVRLDPATSLTGRVVDARGAPVPGAHVALRGRVPDAGRLSVPGPAATTFQATSTHADGRFTFADVAIGAVELMASAPGYRAATAVPIDLGPAQPATGIELILVPGLTLHGTVRTRSGEPHAGAKVAVDDRPVETDVEGAFVLEGVSPGPAELAVWSRGLRRQVWRIDIEEGMAPLALEVPDGASVAGTVVDAGGRPVAGASLRVVAVNRGDSVVAEALTDHEGAFDVSDLSPDAYRLVADHPEHGRGAHEISLREDDLEPTTGLRVALGELSSLVGDLVGLDAEEVATVVVSARHPTFGSVRGGVDYAGRYRLDRLAPGPWHVVAAVARGGRQAEARVLIRGTEEIHRDLRFEGSTLTGVARFLGDPVAAARIGARGLDRDIDRGATTDPDGQFRMTDLPPGRYRISVVSRRNLLSFHRDITLEGDRFIDLDIEPVTVEGLVRDQHGEPLATASVRLEHQPRSGPGGAVIALSTDHRGRFHIARVPPGRHRLRVRLPGHEPLERTLDLGAVPVESLDLRLRPAPGLHVRLHLPAASRRRYATIALLDLAGVPGRLEAQRLDTAGEAHFDTLPAGDLDLLVRVPGTVARRLRATVPGPILEIELAPAASVEVWAPELAESDRKAWVTVHSLDGKPFGTLDDSGLWRQAWPVASGRALIDGLPSGPWAVQVEASDGRVWRRAIELSAGSRQKIEL